MTKHCESRRKFLISAASAAGLLFVMPRSELYSSVDQSSSKCTGTHPESNAFLAQNFQITVRKYGAEFGDTAVSAAVQKKEGEQNGGL